ncbi:MAG: hypothetical protein OEY94_03540 [Alphaproteobacteria bacterium]|nr:hypothetical protein [Alphaproteobacteria bacterium]
MSDAKIILYKIKNYLINKIGFNHPRPEEGEINPDDIKKADKMITQICANCLDAIGANLEELDKRWVKMREMPVSDERKELAREIFTFSHEIKDIASLCGYELCAHFAESLRDYIEKTELNLKNQRIIIQAHIDAMTVVHKQGLKEDGGPAAEELKKMVKVAIDKYS